MIFHFVCQGIFFFLHRLISSGYYMLSTLDHICVCECVGIMPNESPPAWSPSPPPCHGVGFDPSSQEEVLGKISKLMGTYVQIFGFFGCLCGLKWVKIG